MVATKIAALAATAFLASTAFADVDPIVIKGSKFFYKTNGTQFFIRGVAYQQDPNNAQAATSVNDPLTDEAGCTRDLPYLQKLRTNAVRVYAIDPTKSHDACMNMFADAGIYVIADLSSPTLSIDRSNPAWNIDLYNRYTSVIDVMAKYTNTLGFFAGNEVANNITNTDSMPFVKAGVRDMKSYIKSKNYRALGVGYAADDDASIRQYVRPYVNCGSQGTSVDFFGYNIYSWCGSSATYQTSGYADRTAEFKNYSVPAFFAEYGCNTVQPRTFPDTPALFSDPMDQVWSGGMAYEYFQAERDYGLVEVNGNSISTLSDYSYYSSRIAKATPTSVSASAYTPTNTALQSCPTVGAGGVWQASSQLPPSPNSGICACRVANSTCVANSNVASNAYGDLFNYICSTDSGACAPISANGTTGTYGAYSMCGSKDRLTIAMDTFYQRNGANAQSCDFGGNATTTSAGVASSCTSLLNSAGGSLGTGVVTGGASAGSSSGAASAVQLPAFDFGVLAVGIYSVVAAVAGAGMFLL